MRVEQPIPNALRLHLEPGEVLYCRHDALRSHHSGRLLAPPLMWRAPIGRALHGCWRLNALKGGGPGGPVDLIGADPVGAFCVVELAAGERLLVHLDALVGFVVEEARPASPPVLHTRLGALLRPGYWMLGDALPTEFNGPVTLLLNAPRLRAPAPEEGPAWLPRQLVAFDPAAELRIAPRVASTCWDVARNALTFDSVVHASGDARLHVRGYADAASRPRSFLARAMRHLFVSTLLILLVLWAADQLRVWLGW